MWWKSLCEMSISIGNYCLVLPNRRRFLNLIPTQVFGQSSCHQKKRFMKSLSGLFIVIFIFFGCDKDRTTHTDCIYSKPTPTMQKRSQSQTAFGELFLLWKRIACRWCQQQIQPVNIALLNEQWKFTSTHCLAMQHLPATQQFFLY